MKIKVIGKQIENNQKTRYSLIAMKMKRNNINETYDDTVTYVYHNNLKFLKEVSLRATEENITNKDYYLDMRIYDYQEMHYVRGY